MTLCLSCLPQPASTFVDDRQGVHALRRSEGWQTWDDLHGNRWYTDDWSVEAEVLDGWMATGGVQRRVTHLYLVRLPEKKLYSNTYPADLGYWALRLTSPIAPVGYGYTALYRSERAARAAVESHACSAQAIGHIYLGTGSMTGLLSDLAACIADTRAKLYREAFRWTPSGDQLRSGFSDPRENWSETPLEAAMRALGAAEDEVKSMSVLPSHTVSTP